MTQSNGEDVEPGLASDGPKPLEKSMTKASVVGPWTENAINCEGKRANTATEPALDHTIYSVIT